MGGLVDSLLPEEAVNWSDDRLRKGRALVFSGVILLAAVSVQATINASRGYDVGVVQLAPLAVVIGIALFVLRRTGRVLVALNLIVGAYVVSLAAIIFLKRGVGANPPMAALMVAPVFAIFVGGVKAGRAWLLVVAATVCAALVGAQYGIVTEDTMPQAMRTTGDSVMVLLIGGLVFMLAVAFHTDRAKAMDEVIEREARLRRAEVERLEAITTAQAAETARLAAMGQLAAATAHEINNPLSYVINNLDYVRDILMSGGTESLVDPLDEAIDGARRVKVIVRGLQTFTRQRAEASSLDVHETIDAALRLTDGETRSRARLVREFGDLPPIHGNEGELVQVFTNLILNAAHAIPEGRKRDHEIAIRTSVGEEGCIIEVADNGCGIPRSVLERVFEPFFTTKKIGHGTGLGLAVCRNIVHNHGGTITATSGDDGTCVTVTIPAFDGVVEAPPVTSGEEPASIPRARILIVDDDPLVVRALGRRLRVHDLTAVFSGAEALELLNGGQEFDVILCDLMMPDVTGMDLYAEVRNTHPRILERMVFMSGGTFTERAKTFRSEVDNTFVSKPLDIDRVERILADRLAGS